MTKGSGTQSISLFYSYSHKDRIHREKMEKVLSLLKENGLSQWSDEEIVPGTEWSEEIRAQLGTAHIVVFLMSFEFCASPPCRAEWEYATELATQTDRHLIPVILQTCPWKDIPRMRSRQALPVDAKPITSYTNEDDAWQEVYDGIKRTLTEISTKISARQEFVDEVCKIEFIVSGFDPVAFDDLFVFPIVRLFATSRSSRGSLVPNADALLQHKRVLLCGSVLGGKSALCAHLFRKLAETPEPGVIVPMDEVRERRPSTRVYRDIFSKEFSGSYEKWLAGRTTVFLDDFSSANRDIEHLEYCLATFDRVIVTILMDVYVSFFHNESSPFAAIDVCEISPLTHNKQSALIKKWLDLSRVGGGTHGDIDRMEEEVNGIIVDNRILPRYPHFVLSILQMRERFMPRDTTITSYGHCHYVLILAHLIKAGTSNRDAEISTCMNVCSHYAYFKHLETVERGKLVVSDSRFEVFWRRYRENFVVEDTTLERIRRQSYGILQGTQFRANFMYWYFLGKYLADNREKADVGNEIDRLIGNIDRPDSCFALMSLVHHCGDLSIVDSLVVTNRKLMGSLRPAVLDYLETKGISSLLHALPHDLLGDDRDIEGARKAERDARDVADDRLAESERSIHESGNEEGLQLYRLLKSMDVLSQVVRNRFGVINKKKLVEILGVIIDSGLRMVHVALWDEERILKFAREVQRRSTEDVPTEKVCMITAMVLISVVVVLSNRVSDAISKNELRDLVAELLNGSPARELVAYISWLRVEDRFGSRRGGKGHDVDHVVRLLDSAANEFIWHALSMVTQKYLLTHDVARQSEQAIREAIRRGPRRNALRGGR